MRFSFYVGFNFIFIIIIIIIILYDLFLFNVCIPVPSMHACIAILFEMFLF